jgi:hypothetical protein
VLPNSFQKHPYITAEETLRTKKGFKGQKKGILLLENTNGAKVGMQVVYSLVSGV